MKLFVYVKVKFRAFGVTFGTFEKTVEMAKQDLVALLMAFRVPPIVLELVKTGSLNDAGTEWRTILDERGVLVRWRVGN